MFYMFLIFIVILERQMHRGREKQFGKSWVKPLYPPSIGC